MLRPDRLVRYAPDPGAGGAGGSTDNGGDTGNGAGTQGDNQAPATWDAFLETLPPEAKTLHEQHESGLRSTVQATRQERDALKARLDALIGALDGKEPATVRQELEQMRSGLDTANARADFFEAASKPEVGCRNPKLAWMVAQAESLFDRRGNPDWAAIKQTAPELFGAAIPQSNAGSGNNNPPPGNETMDDFIRQKAGVA